MDFVREFSFIEFLIELEFSCILPRMPLFELLFLTLLFFDLRATTSEMCDYIGVIGAGFTSMGVII
jgi:hypothetical protein